MYLVGAGHEHLGPGTSMVQFLPPEAPGAFGGGMGAVGGVPEFFADCRSTSGTCAEGRGMGCAGCGGKCKSGCGMGLFDGGLDTSTWGLPEWGIAAGLAVYVASSLFGDARRGARRVREGVSSRVRSGRRRLGKRVAGA